MSDRVEDRRGGALVATIPLLAIALLAVDDHVLKPRFPGVITGKLSDVAGLAFFPTALVAAFEILVPRARVASIAVARAAIALTAAGFVAVKTLPIANDAFRCALGAGPFALRSFRAIFGAPSARFACTQVERDPSDLVALLALVVPYAIATRRHARLSPPRPVGQSEDAT